MFFIYSLTKQFSVVFVLLCFLPNVRKLCLASQSIDQFQQNLLQSQTSKNDPGFDQIHNQKDLNSEGSGFEEKYEKYVSTNATISYLVSTITLPTTEIPDEIVQRINDKPSVNSAINAILILVVIQTMLGLGCTMDLALIREHIYNPASKFFFET